MLRFFFWTLLLANAFFLALNFGYLGNWSSDVHEPQRLKMQQHAEQLQMLSPAAALAASEAPVEKKQETVACLEVGNFPQADAPHFEAKLKELGLGDRQSRNNIIDVASHMVFIPSLGSKDGADKKAAELRRLGLNDFFIVQDQSNLRWGISLGVFKTEEAAKAHLANLNNKGVKSARIGPRSVSTAKFSYQLRSLSGDEKKRFDVIKAEFPTQETHNCQVAPASRH
jgi:hypothetical protein